MSAELLPKTPRYRPSNGTEGAGFISQWCGECERDRDGLCPIVAMTMAYDIDDPRYPPEWIQDENGPRCTAWIEEGKPLPPERCAATPDMFEAPQ